MGNKFALFIGFLLIAASVWAQDIPAKPDGYVLDLSGKLQADEKTTLEQKLRACGFNIHAICGGDCAEYPRFGSV